MRSDIRFIDTEHAPKASGPYSQAIAAGPYLFLAGQIPSILKSEDHRNLHRSADQAGDR